MPAPIRALLAACLAIAAVAPSARAADPTAQELHFLYEVNRARHDPPAWAAEYGLGGVTGGDGSPVTLVGVAPRPPLALNLQLVDSSRFKAQEMATNNYFGHMSQVDGRYANEVVRSFGYPLPLEWPIPGQPGSFYTFDDGFNGVESLGAGFGPGLNDLAQGVNAVIGLIVDTGNPALGHRIHLLAMDDYDAIFVEAGAGYGVNPSAEFQNYWAFHTGVRLEAQTYLTGVVYADGNANFLFDPGEGLAGVTVQAGAASTTTGPTGGYSLLVASGTHAVACSGGTFAGSAAADVSVAGSNREVDCISGQPQPWVDFVEAPEPSALALGGAAVVALGAVGRRKFKRRTVPFFNFR